MCAFSISHGFGCPVFQGRTHLGGEGVPSNWDPSRAFEAKIWHLKLGWNNFLIIRC